MKKKTTLYVTQGAVIAALYVALTYVSNTLGLAYSGIQFRLSEILTILPVFTPAAIPGLTIGCIVANISSPMGLLDIVCGSVATFSAAIASYFLRRFTIKGIPVFSAIPPVIFNALIVGWELWYTLGKTAEVFFVSALQVFAGQTVMCIIIGIPFMVKLKKSDIFSKIM